MTNNPQMPDACRRLHVSRTLRIVAWAVVLLLGVGTISTAEERSLGKELDGLPIVEMVFIRNNVFDTTKPESDSWPYRAANAIHIVSRERFLRSVVLFEEGDLFAANDAAESERILRSLGFINPVYITAERCEGGVRVTIDTHDQWTLEVGGQFGLFGNRSKFGIVFAETNFLGWGRTVEVEYKSDQERTTWNYLYGDPALFGTRWRGRLIHRDASDGYTDEVLVELPFFALASRRAYGGEWKRNQQIAHLYADGESVVEGQQESETWRAWAGFRLPGREGVTHRLTFGLQQQQVEFSNWSWSEDGANYQQPESRYIRGPYVEFERIVERFEVLKGFRAWSAQEDVEMGPNYRVGVGYSRPGFGGDIERMLFDGEVRARRLSGQWLMLGDVWLSGRLDERKARNVVGGVQFALSQLGTRGWQFRVLYEDSYQLDRELQLTLGADNGLRGWNPDTFDGTRRAVANLQWRTLVKRDFLQLFSIGAVVFVDAGQTWGARVGRTTDGVRADAGIGLLLDLTSLSLSKLARVEVAFPDDGSGYVVTVTGSALF
ncbi:MAG: hypothetical protein GY906_33040 [bacterium]|nr:hypothetical protein [bacterium]